MDCLRRYCGSFLAVFVCWLVVWGLLRWVACGVACYGEWLGLWVIRSARLAMVGELAF